MLKIDEFHRTAPKYEIIYMIFDGEELKCYIRKDNCENWNLYSIRGEITDTDSDLQTLLDRVKKIVTGWTVYWKDGSKVYLNQGCDIGEALTLCGYSAGSVEAIDFYTIGNDDGYEYKCINGKNAWVPK